LRKVLQSAELKLVFAQADLQLIQINGTRSQLRVKNIICTFTAHLHILPRMWKMTMRRGFFFYGQEHSVEVKQKEAERTAKNCF